MATNQTIVSLDETAVNVFTDGSSFSGPRRGGVGILVVTVDSQGDEVTEEFPREGYRNGTNQEMELQAAVEALRLMGGRHPQVDVDEYSKVVIHTDSMYVAENYTNAVFVWPRRKWLTRDGNPIVNASLWKELTDAARKVPRRVEIVWHKGHKATNPHNKNADKLAKASAKGSLRAPVSISRVRRKHSEKQTELGSIRPEGQRLTLRIITDRYLSVQRMYKYKCEVVAKSNKYAGNVDELFSHIMLNAGHTYVVRLNDDPSQPRIVECFREVLAKA